MAGVRRGPGWYRGDCHVHSVYSDGELTPARLVAEARAAGLHFIATTDHNSIANSDTWEAEAGGDLLVVLGAEVTTRTGHWLALGIEPGQLVDWDYRVRDGRIDQAMAGVHEVGGLCVAAHPHAPYPTGRFMYAYQGFDAVEVWNGQWSSDRPWQADNEAALAEWGRSLAADVETGQWRPAIGNSDAHLAGQLGTPQTVVFAEELSSPGVLAGIRAGRSWIAESAAVQLSFLADAAGRSAGVGERLVTAGEPVTVRARIQGVPSATVAFHSDRGAVHRGSLPAHGAGTATWCTSAAETAFVRVELRHPDGRMAALSNPIILH
ncbi:putative metal-dependent phosphoesterase TrpH [Kitasatospora acidiphila]